ERRRSLFLARLAYIIRGLSFEPETRMLRSRGCIKASWIAEHFGLSLRAVRLARASMIRSGFIAKDSTSFQRKLNRDGSYFEINLALYAGTPTGGRECAGIELTVEASNSADLRCVPAYQKDECAGTQPPECSSRAEAQAAASVTSRPALRFAP